MQRYRVGDTVRNYLLGLPTTSVRWLVVGSSPALWQSKQYEAVQDEPYVYRHRQTGEIFELARREQRDPQTNAISISCDEQVILADDLARRDLTVHAIAQSELGNVVDPFGGEQDLRAGILRHVTPQFAQHPEYLLSTAVTAATLARWGFRISHGTHALMRKMVNEGVFYQLSLLQRQAAVYRALMTERPGEFFHVLHRCGALLQLSPGMAQMLKEAEGNHRDRLSSSFLQNVDRLGSQTPQLMTRLSGFRLLLGPQADRVWQDLAL